MSDHKLSALASTKRRRDVVWALITRLERHVDGFKTKEELAHADRLAIQRLVMKFEALDTKFR